MNELVAIVLGFLAGAVGGLVGVGGGILFVPALAIFLDQSQLEAEATSLVAIMLVALVGTWRQYGYGNVRVRDALVIGALSPLGVVGGHGARQQRLRARARGRLRMPGAVLRRAARAPRVHAEPTSSRRKHVERPLDAGRVDVQVRDGAQAVADRAA